MGTNERRSDAVAQCMGQLLLKGYRMLATSCDTCNNVLLEDREGVILCINCTQPVKDEPLTPPTNETQVLSESGEKGVGPTTTPQHPLHSAEVLLLMEITSATQHLENLPSDTDLEHKQLYIRHMRECAETIAALRRIN